MFLCCIQVTHSRLISDVLSELINSFRDQDMELILQMLRSKCGLFPRPPSGLWVLGLCLWVLGLCFKVRGWNGKDSSY